MDLALTRLDQVSEANPDDGDLFIDEAGQFVVLADDDPEAEAQAIAIGLSTVQGEWFLDLDAGLPLASKILGMKKLRAPRLREIVRQEILRRGSVDPTSLTITTQSQGRSTVVSWKGELIGGGDVSGTTATGG